MRVNCWYDSPTSYNSPRINIAQPLFSLCALFEARTRSLTCVRAARQLPCIVQLWQK
eukprot:m.223384 g.223384  ORF g.223384 m.223384 type:complete len:57 (+) comp15139_c0_seq7:521-691(+)